MFRVMGCERRMCCAPDEQDSSAVGRMGYLENVEGDEGEPHWTVVTLDLGRVDESAKMCWLPSGPAMLVLQNI